MDADVEMADRGLRLGDRSQLTSGASGDASEKVADLAPGIPDVSKSAGGPVGWRDLPRKDQLFILFLCRFADFLQIASVQTYIFYQLKSIDSTSTDTQVSTQAGIIQGVFTGAQVLTAVLWGRAADSSWCGRKMVVVIGIFGTAISCVGYGLARTFFWAVFWRALGGAVNGIVGIIRTMISEVTVEKRFQSRAFLILPLSFNVAGVLGPMMGGWLADPVNTLPGLFGPGRLLESELVKAYPYALPSIANAAVLTFVGFVVLFGLEETGEMRGQTRFSLSPIAGLKHLLFQTSSDRGYSKLPESDSAADVQLQRAKQNMASTDLDPSRPESSRPKLPFRRLWTRNLVLTLCSTAFYDFHLGAFANMWTLFLATPRAANNLSSALAGGLGMQPSTLGLAMSMLGWLGMLLQVFLYPPVHARLGTLKSFQRFLLLFPVQYFLTPFLCILPSTTSPTGESSGGFIWFGILSVLLIHTVARTMTLPASIILVNNASPHPSVLSTVHTLGQSVSAAFRTLGPIVGGWWYGAGLSHGVVGPSWWAVATVAGLGWAIALMTYEGSGHEIDL